MNKVYLLLRNNKQSGPYSLEELVQLHLRPLDLIWIEGRSAAWQYASEIKVFAPYLPQESASDQQERRTTIEESHKVYLPADNQPSGSPAPKKIFVSLPNGAANKPAQQSPKREPVNAREMGNEALRKAAEHQQARAPYAAESKRPPSEVVTGATINDYHNTDTKPKQVTSDNDQLVTKYTSSLEEKEEAYTQWLYQKKTKKSSLAPEWLGGIAMVVLLLMGTGAYYFTHRTDDANSKPLTATDTRSSEELVSTVPPPDPSVSQPAVVNPSTAPNDIKNTVTPPPVARAENSSKRPVAAEHAAEKNKPAKKPNVATPSTVPPVTTARTQQNTPVTAPEPAVKPSEKPARQKETETAEAKKKKTFTEKVDGFFNKIIHAKKVEPVAKQAGAPDETPPPTQNDRKATHRGDEVAQVKETGKKDLTGGIQVTTIESTTNWMQGVHGVKMKVDNRNDVTVTNAAVEVRYLNDQNGILEKRTLHINDIPPGKSVTLSIPDHRLAERAEASLISASGF